MRKKKTAPQRRGAGENGDFRWLIGAMVLQALLFVINLIVLFTCCDSADDVLQLVCSLIFLALSFARCLALWNER